MIGFATSQSKNDLKDTKAHNVLYFCTVYHWWITFINAFSLVYTTVSQITSLTKGFDVKQFIVFISLFYLFKSKSGDV